MIEPLLSFRNKVDFKIRQLIRWKRRGLKLSRVAKGTVFNHLPDKEKRLAREIETRLLKNYDLQDVIERGDEDNYRINLYYLELMEKTLGKLGVTLPNEIQAADVGCSSWFYVRGMYEFLRRWKMAGGKRQVELNGYEIDAYRPYLNLYSRFDYAGVYAERLGGAHYTPGPFIRQDDHFDVICQFFPFVFAKDHLEWGLPGDLFFPKILLNDIWWSLKKNGVVLVVNQGLEEHRRQKELFAEAGIQAGASFKFDSVLFHYDVEHYVLGAIKNG